MPIVFADHYFLATAAILEDETVFEVHKDIASGSKYEIDHWNGSIWFQYEDYDWTDVGIAWLKGFAPKKVFFPWVGKFQLKEVK